MRLALIGVVLAVAGGCKSAHEPEMLGGSGRDRGDKSDKPDKVMTGSGGGNPIGISPGGGGPHGGGGLLELGDMEAAGEIDKSVVKQVVKQNLTKLQYCYEKTLLANPGIGGTVTAKFKIAIDGSVRDATASGFNPDVDACVIETVRTFKFPKPTASDVEVSYPFTFKAA